VVAYYLLAAKHEQAQQSPQAGDGGAAGAGPVAVGDAHVCACGWAMCRSYLMIHWGGCFHPGLSEPAPSLSHRRLTHFLPLHPVLCCVNTSPGLRDGDAPFTPDDAAALAVMGRAALPRDTVDGPAAPAGRCACPLGPAYGPLRFPCSALAAVCCWAPTAAGAGAGAGASGDESGCCGGCGGLCPSLTARGDGREGLKSVADEEGH